MISCSADALDAGEGLLGTAPLAQSWVVIEQPGPWGHDAIAEGRLPDVISAHLARAKGTGTTVLLARHPERRSLAGPRHVWAAHCAPGHARLRHGMVGDLAALLEWDFSAIAAGDLPELDEAEDGPLQLVCTHSGRDRCCAVTGRALATELIERMAPNERVWESSHIGGHRFAPVTLTLPLGVVHGRLSVDEAELVMTRAATGGVVLDRLRGRTSLTPQAQVAVAEVMRRTGITDIDAFTAFTDGSLVRVRHGDGHSWTVDVETQDLPRERMESCAKEPVAGQCLTCVALEADF